MSWAHVQGTGTQLSGFAYTLSVSYAGSVTSGNLLVSGAVSFGSTSPPVASDDKSNSWGEDTSGTPTASDWISLVGHAVAGGSNTPTVTWTWTTGDGFPQASMSIDEYSHAGTATVDSAVSLSSLGTTNTPSVGTLTVTGNDLIYAVIGISGTSSITAGSGMTLRYNAIWVNNSFQGIGAEDALNQTTNINPGWTLTNTPTSYASGVAYAEGTAAATHEFPPFPGIPGALLAI